MDSIVSLNNISKSFGPVEALKDVTIEVYPNEIVGLVGENGAGKSTLVKILSGVYEKDSGEIRISGQEVEIRNPSAANQHGIFMVFQEQSILINLTVYENLFLGFEHYFQEFGVISNKKMISEAKKVLQKIDMDIDPRSHISELSFVQRQMIEILRNLWKADISGAENIVVVLDEPTSALSDSDAEILFDQINELKSRASIVFISHKLNEIVEFCDRTYVLKDGKQVGVFQHDEMSIEKLRQRMIGGTIQGEYYLVNQQRKPGEKIILEVQNLSKKGVLDDISFKVHEGEVVSITGTLGSGKETLCEILYGLEKFEEGQIFLDQKPVRIKNPVDAVSHGIGFSPDDRKVKGLILGMSLRDNLTLPIMHPVISLRELSDLAKKIVERLRILAPTIKTFVRTLSGGNQQKVIFGRLIISDRKVIILAFPTRGVDVGAKQEIYSLIREMADKGKAIILMGDSFEEDIGLANRIIALKDGKMTGILDAETRKPELEELANYIL
jgi:ribose transport system ATP-binding protein